MADADDSQKTEQPSHRKLTKARGQGQVIQSREINSVAMLAAGAVLILLLAPPLMGKLQGTLARFLDPASLLDGDGVLWEGVRSLLGVVAGIFVVPILLLMVAALAGSLLQTGLVLATDKIGFDWSRLSPVSGLGRLFSMRATVEFVKGMAKFALVMVIVWFALRPELGRLAMLPGFEMALVLAELHHLMLRLSVSLLLVLGAMALLDYVYQRFSFLRTMRMSKQEVKEENKQAEGDPMVKARLRHIRMERARKRMMAAVPGASVVVTNPTHYAVALSYEMGSKGAPRVVAKGADLIAQRIREIAEENDVPLVENPPLARALYANVEIDREIPPEHYRAVAEIISYVYRLKGKLKHKQQTPA